MPSRIRANIDSMAAIEIHATTTVTRTNVALCARRRGVGCFIAIHDRDSIFARNLDESIKNLGMTVLKSPPHSPKANAICERVIGTIRRECLDWLIPLSEAHLRAILRCWVTHYNGGRPHSALGPGVPDPPKNREVIPKLETRHRLAADMLVLVKSVLGGLHQEYSVGKVQLSV